MPWGGENKTGWRSWTFTAVVLLHSSVLMGSLSSLTVFVCRFLPQPHSTCGQAA